MTNFAHYLEKESPAGLDGPKLLLDYLRLYCENQQIVLPSDFFETYLQEGKCAVLLDGNARDALRGQPGVTVIDHRLDEGYVTPAEAAGEDAVFVSRLRTDPTVENGLAMWVVSDNLRKGAALNAVQIAERLVEDHLS